MKQRLKVVFLNRKESVRESVQEVHRQNDSSRKRGRKK